MRPFENELPSVTDVARKVVGHIAFMLPPCAAVIAIHNTEPNESIKWHTIREAAGALAGVVLSSAVVAYRESHKD